MKYLNEVLLLNLVCLLLYISNVEAIKCFQCSSLEPGCAELLKNSTDSAFLKECVANDLYDGNKPFCRKMVHKITDFENYVRITRSCGWVQHKKNISNCYENDDDFKNERSCQCFTDGCNGAGSITLSGFITLSLLTSLCASIYRFY